MVFAQAMTQATPVTRTLVAVRTTLMAKTHLGVAEHWVGQRMPLLVAGTTLVVVRHLGARAMTSAATATTLVANLVVARPSWKAMMGAMGTPPLTWMNPAAVHHLVRAEKVQVAKGMTLMVVGVMEMTQTANKGPGAVLEVAKVLLQWKLGASLMVVATAVNLPTCLLVRFLL